MGIFNKKKKIPEPEVPGFAEIEKNKLLILDNPMSKITPKNNLDFSTSFNQESINPEKEEDLDLKYQEENDDWSDINYGNNEQDYSDIGDLPEIPGIAEIQKEKALEKEKNIIPDIERKDPSVVDIDDVKKNQSKMKKLKKEEQEGIELDNLNSQTNLKNESKMKKSIIKDSDKSIFVKIEDFNSVTLAINEIKNKIILIKKNIDQINQIKEKEDEEIKNWEKELVLIKEKLAYVDEILKTKTEN